MHVHNLPLRLWWLRDGLYVIKSHPDFAELLGARVEAFGSLTAERRWPGPPYISRTDTNIRVKSRRDPVLEAVLQRIASSSH
jgi:hypothetical protein